MIAGEIETVFKCVELEIQSTTVLILELLIQLSSFSSRTTPAEDPCLVTGSHQVVYYLRLIEYPTIH